MVHSVRHCAPLATSGPSGCGDREGAFPIRKHPEASHVEYDPVMITSTPLTAACTLTETAHLLNRSRATIRRLLAKGRIPGIRLGRDWRIPRAAVIALSEGRPWQQPVGGSHG